MVSGFDLLDEAQLRKALAEAELVVEDAERRRDLISHALSKLKAKNTLDAIEKGVPGEQAVATHMAK